MTNPTTRTLGKDEWMTPSTVFNPVHAVFHFDFDAAAGSAREARLPVFIDPVTDALSCSWKHFGSRAWLNPPYGRDLNKWFEKVSHQVRVGPELVVMLTYANTDTKYWEQYVVGDDRCHEVIFLTPRVKFVDPDDPSKKNGAPKGSALLVYRSSVRRGPLHHSYWNFKKQPFPTRSNL